MIQDVRNPQTEAGLSIEGMQKKNYRQNGRRYRQRQWPEMLRVETKPNGYELKVGEKDFFYFNRLSLFAGVMVHVWLEPNKTFDWPIPLRKY